LLCYCIYSINGTFEKDDIMENEKARVAIKQQGDISIVELLDNEILDEFTINEIADTLFSLVAENTPAKIVLSFAQVKHLSSMALGTLIRLNKRVDESGGQLKLCSITKNLYEIFIITKLNKLFDIYDDEQASLASF
jgi:anti-sigma B factor antagonist